MIVLWDDVRKDKEGYAEAALQKLIRFLNTTEPLLIKFLQRLWSNQQRAITYKELREALLRGSLSPEILEDWRQDYSRFVIRHVRPLWEDALRDANEPIRRDGLIWRFDPDKRGVREWVDANAARFVTVCTKDQIEAMRFVIRKATQLNDYNVDTLAHVIRPMVGLNRPQAAANLNYYNSMIESGMREKEAVERCVRYSARQNRYRAMMISRTELAFAHNQGSYLGTLQAQEEGLLGHTVKRWCTAADERVCHICGSLDGKEIEMDREFMYEDKRTGRMTRINPKLRYHSIGKVPPAHPHCRCTVLYEETAPPVVRVGQPMTPNEKVETTDTGSIIISWD